MSDEPVDPPVEPESAPETAPARSDNLARQKLGPLPVWLWVVLAVIAGVLLIVLGLTLIARDGTPPSLSHSPSPSGSSASPTPSSTPSSTPVASPSATAGGPAGQGTFDSDLPNFLSDTLNSQNTAVLSQGGTFSNPVFLLAANSDLNQNMSPDDAVNAMQFMFTPGDPNPWDLALSDSVLAGYRAGPYGQYFPVGAIVARSHDGHVFSFIGHDSTITTMFMAGSDELLH